MSEIEKLRGKLSALYAERGRINKKITETEENLGRLERAEEARQKKLARKPLLEARLKVFRLIASGCAAAHACEQAGIGATTARMSIAEAWKAYYPSHYKASIAVIGEVGIISALRKSPPDDFANRIEVDPFADC